MSLTQVKGSLFPDEQTLQPGMIMMWAGNENQIPTGWQLCNGSGNTSNGISVPDLRNRFIVGSGSTYDTGDTGGATSRTTSSAGNHSHSVTVNSGGNHSHSVTVNSTTLSEGQMGVHSHLSPGKRRSNSWDINTLYDFGEGYTDVGTLQYGTGVYSSTYPMALAKTDQIGSSQPHTHTASTNNTGSHTHTASSGSTGNHSHTVDILPPYYALAYIIKL